jgi:xanthine dehydrogenase accessory factor
MTLLICLVFTGADGRLEQVEMSSRVNPPAVASTWLGEGRRVVSALLVETIGSAPLAPGAEMLIDDQGRIEGSITGGCVEGAVAQESQRVLRSGESRLVTYGISDDEAAGVGLMCGGTVRVFIHELRDDARESLEAVASAVENDEPAALATLLDGPRSGAKLAILGERHVGTLGVNELLDRTVEREAGGFLDEGKSELRRYGAGGEVMGSDLAVCIQAFSSPPEMIIFGAIDFSAAVAKVARNIGYRVTICDARAPFLESPRFSEAAKVVVDWPDRYLSDLTLGPRDVVLVFTHDPKFDEPALIAALSSGAGYIGALGSRRTQAQRAARLRETGVSEEDLNRIHAPCGLDLGARTPAETAVSILAEVIAQRTGRSAESLQRTTGAIHPTETVAEGSAPPGEDPVQLTADRDL